MRSIFLSLALAPIALAAQNSPAPADGHGLINWVSLEKAQELAKKDGKPLMIDVYTTWCGPCKMLSSKTFANPEVAAYVNEHYHAVKFDAEGPDPAKYNGQTFSNPDYNPAMKGGRNGTHQLTMQIAPVNGRVAYPTVVYMDKDGTILSPVQGYLTPAQLQPILIFFAEDHYKTEEFQGFYQGFKPTWPN